MAGRLFNEKEVREILKKASEGRPNEKLAHAEGISLQELQQVGSELGFDPQQIALAAQSIDTAPPAGTSFLSGRIFQERVVDGEVNSDDWLGMVGVIQRHHKGAGVITQRGSNFDWAGSDENSGSLTLAVKVREGKTRVRLESNRWIEIVMASVFCPTFALIFSLSLAKHGNGVTAIPVCLFFAGLLFGLVRFFRQRHLQSVSGLMDRLIDEVEAEKMPHILTNSTVVTSSPAEQATRS